MISLKRSSLHCASGEPRSFSPWYDTYLGGIHLVDSNDELPDTKREGEQSMLSGLTTFGDTLFELANASGDDENGAIGLRGTSDHVLDEITVSGGIDDLGFIWSRHCSWKVDGLDPQ